MELSKRYANFIRVGSDGNMGVFDQKGNRFIRENIGSDGKPAKIAIIPSSTDNNDTSYPLENNATEFESDPSNFPRINPNAHTVINLSRAGNGYINQDFAANLQLSNQGTVTGYNNHNASLNGFPFMIGNPDLRTGVTAVDASPITIFSSTASGIRYEVKARILATAGTSATYTISWTEGGAVRTVALTVSATGTEYHDNFIIAPTAGTNITAQITSLTSSTVNVDAIVSVLG